MSEPSGPSFQPPQPPPAQLPPLPPRKKSRGVLALIPGVIVFGLIIAAIAYSFLDKSHSDTDQDGLAAAKVGDCVSYDPGAKSDNYQLDGCGDAKAKYSVVGLLPANVDGADRCVDVPGAVSFDDAPPHTLCLGPKGVDPSMSVNGIKVGACTSEEGSSRASCSSPRHRKVLKIMKDVEKKANDWDKPGAPQVTIADQCVKAGAHGTDIAYGYGIEEIAPDPTPSSDWSRVLCLSKAS